MNRFLYTKTYSKKASRFLQKHPELTGLYKKTLMLAEVNLEHPLLSLRKLDGRLSGMYSISIDSPGGISIYIFRTQDTIIPIDINEA